MIILKSICIAFSIYSAIPVPDFKWREKEFEYNLIFFPWVGAVIGALVLLWAYVARLFAINNTAFALIGTAIPLLVSGGFHVDGFMDTSDAFCSHKSREEKLRILKDPHIGAFAVIRLAVAGLIYAAAFSILSYEAVSVFAFSFYFSRTLSGISVITFPKAKNDGMLSSFSKAAHSAGKITLYALVIESIVCAVFMIISNTLCGIVIITAGMATFAYYRYRSIKELGGITGDIAGYFVTVAETTMCVASAACVIFGLGF